VFNGNTVSYDLDGNMLSNGSLSCTYDSANRLIFAGGHTYTYNAEDVRIRNLCTDEDTTYSYDTNVIRTSKTVNRVKHIYTLDGTKILRETWGSNTIVPLYDNEDSVCGILYNNVPYYFIKNLQGDVIAIVDKDAQTVARYSYDAWGNHKIYDINNIEVTSSSHIGTINPFRYRGYYYDEEIDLYYLQSRYYNSDLGRFINADSVDLLTLSKDCLLTNLFEYCSNNAVSNDDRTGFAGFRDLWNAIKNAFNFVKSIADQAYSACQGATSIKQIKKLSKQSGKSQRQIMRELKKLAADSERCFKHFKIAGIVISVLSVIIFAVSYLQYGKSLFSDVYALIVDLFIEAANWLICKLAELTCQAIPACGLIIGFAVSWAIGMLISAFFTATRKKRMTKEYTAKMKKSTRWYDWFINLFCSVPAAF
jgi:RHS repeat-associated protein